MSVYDRSPFISACVCARVCIQYTSVCLLYCDISAVADIFLETAQVPSKSDQSGLMCVCVRACRREPANCVSVCVMKNVCVCVCCEKYVCVCVFVCCEKCVCVCVCVCVCRY